MRVWRRNFGIQSLAVRVIAAFHQLYSRAWRTEGRIHRPPLIHVITVALNRRIKWVFNNTDENEVHNPSQADRALFNQT